jgi:hypothetical protein
MCARPIVAMYRRTVAGFLPAFTSYSMNARMVFGSAGRNDSPRPSQNAWNIAPSAFCARSVFAEYAPSAIPCHSRRRSNGPIAGWAGVVTEKIQAAGWAISWCHPNTLCIIHAITSFIARLILHV